MTWPYYNKGDRVRLSEAGRAKGNQTYRGKPVQDRLGTVVRANRKWCVMVVWDGNRPTSGNYYHYSFLEPA